MPLFMGGELPEEIKQQLLSMMDHEQMHQTSSHHDIMRLFEEQSKDNLRTMTSLFSLLSRDGSSIARYLEGIGVSYLHIKHDICAGCGKSHTPDFVPEAMAEENAQSPATSSMSAGEFFDRLSEYRLVHSLVDGKSQFVCRDCGMDYVSLEDRMLRKPDECAGCQHKSKWG